MKVRNSKEEKVDNIYNPGVRVVTVCYACAGQVIYEHPNEHVDFENMERWTVVDMPKEAQPWAPGAVSKAPPP
eukprot:12936392-Prorocentrum_lima.AAC.1